MLELASTRRFDRHVGGAGLVLALLLTLTSGTARADLAIAADLEADIPVSPDLLDTGPGFAIRIGYQLHLPLLTLTPEIGFHYASFDPEPTLYRGIAGARLGIGEVLRGGIFAHVGIGQASIETVLGDASHTAFTFDVGAFLDLTILPLIDVGIHVGYGHLSPEGNEDALAWVPLGVHVALVF
jgi:hypothetical protein